MSLWKRVQWWLRPEVETAQEAMPSSESGGKEAHASSLPKSELAWQAARTVEDQIRFDPPVPPRVMRPRSIRRLTMGIDWGTSCTKVIVRDRYGQEDPAFVLDFGASGLEAKPFLLPSSFYLSEDGLASLRKPSDRARQVDAIKLDLMNERLSKLSVERAKQLSTLYLALVIRESRQVWAQRWGALYGGWDIRWEINLGIPAGSLDESTVVARFLHTAESARTLADSERPISLVALSQCDRIAGSPTPINVVPEVAAQVATYAKSTLRRQGLHFIVDVGAATVDTAAFILASRDGDDTYCLLATDVKTLGAYRLHTTRIQAVEDVVRAQLANGGVPDQLSPLKRSGYIVPNASAPYLVEGSPGCERAVKETDDKFKILAFRSMHSVLHKVRKDMYPNAPAWSEGVRFFVCGGGSLVAVYQAANRHLSSWWTANTPVNPFAFQPLLHPDNLRWSGNSSNSDFHRLSVSYGLSLPFIEIGQVRSPGEIAPVQRPEVQEHQFANEDTK